MNNLIKVNFEYEKISDKSLPLLVELLQEPQGIAYLVDNFVHLVEHNDKQQVQFDEHFVELLSVSGEVDLLEVVEVEVWHQAKCIIIQFLMIC